MAPVLQNIRHFELQSLHTLVAHDMGWGSEVGAEQRAAAELQRFFNLLASLAWLPALDTLSVSADDEPGPWDTGDFMANIGKLQGLLGKLTRVHTVRGSFGFVEMNYLNMMHCLRDMPSLRHVEKKYFMAFVNANVPSVDDDAFFTDAIESLCELNLASLSDLWDPSQQFWELFLSKGKHARLTDLTVFGLSPRGDSPKDVSNGLMFQVKSLATLPSLQKLHIGLDEHEIFCEEYDRPYTCPCKGSRTPGCTCIFTPGEGNVELREHLFDDLGRHVLSETGCKLSPTDSVENMLEHALKLLKPGLEVEWTCYGRACEM